MFNPNDLLGGLLKSGLRGPSMDRLGHAMGERGVGSANGPLAQILGGLGGSRGGTGPQQGGGDLLGSLAGMAGRQGGGRPMGRDLMMGGLGALAASILSGRGRGMGGGRSMSGGMLGGNMRGAVGAGGLALLGMLAMNALRNSGQSQASAAATPTSPGMGEAPDAMPPDEAVSDRTATLVVRAMIAAAGADGQIDADERRRIVAKLEEEGADQEAMGFLEQEMSRPSDAASLAAEAQDPVVAAQVYAASLLAIRVDTPAERNYLQDLARQLRLEPGTVTQLHQALGVPAG